MKQEIIDALVGLDDSRDSANNDANNGTFEGRRHSGILTTAAIIAPTTMSTTVLSKAGSTTESSQRQPQR